MKSEAEGDRVTVPMTGKHVAYLQSVGLAIFDEGTKPMPPQLREIEANIRSQVESGMTGRFNPETHVVVPRTVENRCARSNGRAGRCPLPGTHLVELVQCHASGTTRTWVPVCENHFRPQAKMRPLSPSPETPEP